jgi:hypothetical protein
MRSFNIWKNQLFQLNSSLLSLVFFFIRHFGGCRFSACCYTMINRPKVPRNYLAVYCTAYNHAWTFWMKLNSCYLNWRLQNVVECNYMWVTEVEN